MQAINKGHIFQTSLFSRVHLPLLFLMSTLPSEHLVTINSEWNVWLFYCSVNEYFVVNHTYLVIVYTRCSNNSKHHIYDSQLNYLEKWVLQSTYYTNSISYNNFKIAWNIYFPYQEVPSSLFTIGWNRLVVWVFLLPKNGHECLWYATKLCWSTCDIEQGRARGQEVGQWFAIVLTALLNGLGLPGSFPSHRITAHSPHKSTLISSGRE